MRRSIKAGAINGEPLHYGNTIRLMVTNQQLARGEMGTMIIVEVTKPLPYLAAVFAFLVMFLCFMIGFFVSDSTRKRRLQRCMKREIWR